MAVVVILCGAYSSEHAHFVSKWHLTKNLAAECVEKVRPAISKL